MEMGTDKRADCDTLIREALRQSYEILEHPLSRDIRASWLKLQQKLEQELEKRSHHVA
jgi:hypothetical protein